MNHTHDAPKIVKHFMSVPGFNPVMSGRCNTASQLRAPAPLHLQITRLVLIATACIIGGCLVLVIFGNHTSEDYTVNQLLALYKE